MLLFLFTLVITVFIAMVLVAQLLRFALKKIAFPKKTLAVFAIVGLICTSSFAVHYFFFSFNVIDRTNMHDAHVNVVSPSGEWTANAFYEPYGGAAGGVNVWVEVESMSSAETKIIYYADSKQLVSLSWEDENELTIRNEDQYSSATTTLDVRTEIYDEFGRACRSLLMRGKYERCMQAQ